ncbi:MAG TPA: TIGR03118 family protein [Telluria sp.]|nr:TIGR03118 family protein [Telluria sp.]
MKPLTSLCALAALLLAACGGGSSNTMQYMTPPPTQPPVVTTTFTATSLVSDTSGAAHADQHLINAWGLAFNPTAYVWVANNGTSTSTLYDGNGVPQSLVVATPDAPTGIVYNGSSAAFRGSPFIFDTESGAIAAWSPAVDRNNAVKIVDNSSKGAVYKGLALAAYNGVSYLYAADFHNKRIDVFDANFAAAAMPGNFSDPMLPAGYAPFGIQAIGDRIYVAYAQRASSGDDEVAGAGLGAVDVFDTAGMLVKRLVLGGALNAPWGMALAPANFGSFSGKLLVANFGDGKINAYDPATGASAGVLSKTGGDAIVIDGLWGIAFGNGVNSQPANTLFYTAGPADEAHGLYGRIDMNAN